MSDADLVKALGEKREALRDFRFTVATSQTRNVKEGREYKRDIARILTEINNRRHAA